MNKRSPSTTLIPTGVAGAARPVTADPTPANDRTIDSADRVITVCHPVWRLGRGGLERQLVQVVNGLADERFRHVVVVSGWNETSEALAAQLDPRARLIREPESAHDRHWSRRLAMILRDEAVDVVHVRGLSLLMDTLMAVELHGDARLACSFHGFQSADDEFSGVRKKVMREALLRCDDRWAVGPSAARAIEARLNLPTGAFGHVCNGVDTDRFTPVASTSERDQIRATLGLPTDRRILLCLGNLKPIKGQQVLLEAIGQLGASARGLCTVFVGEDGHGGALPAYAKAKLPGSDIRFIREQDDPLPWYQAADLFVLPSLSEGMSNALLEAMACGLPVIATNVGGNRDVIEIGRSGRLVEPGDARALARSINELHSDESCRNQLAAAARKRVETAFNLRDSLGAFADRYVRLAERDEVETATSASIAPTKVSQSTKPAFVEAVR